MITKNILKNINLLKKYDTPTICNALEIIDESFKIKGYTKKKFFCLYPKNKPIVGFAKTAIISSIKISKSNIKDIRLDYYDYVNQGNFPKISVVQDICTNPIGSFWGEVNANIHYKLGCQGVLTNGSVRDLDVIPKKFQFLSKTLSPSHAEVKLMNFSKKINIMGMRVSNNDLIHADIHGSVNIPINYLDELFKAINYVSKKEKIILDICKSKKFKYSDFKKAYIKSRKF